MAERIRLKKIDGQESFLEFNSNGDFIGFGLDGRPGMPKIITESDREKLCLETTGLAYPYDHEYEELDDQHPEAYTPEEVEELFQPTGTDWVRRSYG